MMYLLYMSYLLRILIMVTNNECTPTCLCHILPVLQKGRTALHLAMTIYGSVREITQMLLLAPGVDVNARTTRGPKVRMTRLCIPASLRICCSNVSGTSLIFCSLLLEQLGSGVPEVLGCCRWGWEPQHAPCCHHVPAHAC